LSDYNRLSNCRGGSLFIFDETGATVLRELTRHINRIRDAVMGKGPAPDQEKYVTDYLHHKAKAPTPIVKR
jgi:hypothetical protein